MKLSNLFEKLEKSNTWKTFKKSEEAENAFFCAGFFIMNFKQNKFEYSLDFRNEESLFAFKIADEDSKEKEPLLTKDKILESPPAPKPLPKIEEKDMKKIKIDIDKIKEVVEKELEKNKIDGLEEVIAVFQQSDEYKKLVWHLTCMSAGFKITIIAIDPLTGDILKLDKKSLLDFVSVRKNDKK